MKILLLLLLVSATSFAQLTDKDFKITNESVSVGKKITISITGMNDANVDFAFYSNPTLFKSFSVKDFNSMINNSIDESLKNVKNRFTYIPRIISLTFDEKSNMWNVMTNFSAENDFGGVKEGISVSRYSSDGFFYDSKTI